MQGEDKRTSIVIKNIPRNVKKKDIRNMVEKYGNINFLTIAKDQESIILSTDDHLLCFVKATTIAAFGKRIELI